MIDFIKYTPKCYSRQSRDYQVIARLYTALFNISKMYTDASASIWESNIDTSLSMLRSYTVGFFPRYEWELDDIHAVVSCFKYLMRRKGTRKVLEYCISILMRIEQIPGTVDESTVVVEDNCITLYLEEQLATLGVIDDLIRYVLPFGLTYRIIFRKTASGSKVQTEISTASQVVPDGFSSTFQIIKDDSKADPFTDRVDGEKEADGSFSLKNQPIPLNSVIYDDAYIKEGADQ